ncbi:nuclear pore complex protein Nup153-like isoform X2 [Watersipora subatra]|uniref:nuclear pore complex protein Nup153-like isoform X2 n=1 Tax=Watersipora subatra TaxID=2589382 RepID=UPI00355C52AE
MKDFLTPSWLSSFINASGHSDEHAQQPVPQQTVNSDLQDQAYDSRSAYIQKHSNVHTPELSQAAVGGSTVSGVQQRAFSDHPSYSRRSSSSEQHQSTSLLGFAGQSGLGGQSSLGGQTSLTGQDSPYDLPGVTAANSSFTRQFSHNKPVLTERHHEEQQSSYQPYSDACGTILGSTSKRKSFNVSIFAKSFSETMDCSMLDSSSLGNSSFYPGKTVFGGASGQRGYNFSRATPYKRAKKVKKETEEVTKSFTGNSSAAKLILKALHETGLERRKTMQEGGKSEKLFSPAVYLRKKNASVSRSSSISAGNDAFNRSNLEKQNARQPASTVSGKWSSRMGISDTQVSNSTSSTTQAGGGKMRKERLHYSAKKSSQEYAGSVASMSALHSQQPIITSHLSHSPSFTSSEQFTFCSPQPVTFMTATFPSPNSPDGSFVFTSPAKADLTSKVTAKDEQAIKISIFDSVDADKEEQGQKCSSCLHKNVERGDNCVACQASNTGQSSAATSSSANPEHNGWGKLIAGVSDMWNCSVCLLQNSHLVEKCVACGASKVSGEAKKPVAPTSGWGNLLKGSVSKWSCATCLIQNDDGVTNCVACNSSKPVTGGDNFKVSSANTSSGWGDLMKGSTDKWSCSSCLVQNDASSDKCVACTTPNPTQKSSTAANPISSGWGNLIKSGDKWSCSTCLVQNEAKVDKCVACGSSKPFKPASNLPAASGGWGNMFQQSTEKWSCTSCLVQNDMDIKSCAACGSLNPSIKQETVVESKELPTKPPSITGNWNSLFQNADKRWNCSVCTSPNDMAQAVCAACQTPAKEEPAKQVNTVSGWGSLIEKQKGTETAGWNKSPAGWACETCLVSNVDTAIKCVCCETSKPGSVAPEKAGLVSSAKELPPLSKGFSLSSVFPIKGNSPTKSVSSAVTTSSFPAVDKSSAPAFTQFSFKLPTADVSQEANFATAGGVPKSSLSDVSQASGHSVGGFFTSFSKAPTDSSVSETKLATLSSPSTEQSVSSISSVPSGGSSLFSFGKSSATSSFKFGSTNQATSAQPSSEKETPLLFNFGPLSSRPAVSTTTDSTKQALALQLGVVSSSNSGSVKPRSSLGIATTAQQPADISDEKSIFTFGRSNKTSSSSANLAASNSPFSNASVTSASMFGTSGSAFGTATSVSGTLVSAPETSASVFGHSGSMFGASTSAVGNTASKFGNSGSMFGASTSVVSNTASKFGNSVVGSGQSSLFSQKNTSSSFSAVPSDSIAVSKDVSTNDSTSSFSIGSTARVTKKATRRLKK